MQIDAFVKECKICIIIAGVSKHSLVSALTLSQTTEEGFSDV